MPDGTCLRLDRVLPRSTRARGAPTIRRHRHHQADAGATRTAARLRRSRVPRRTIPATTRRTNRPKPRRDPSSSAASQRAYPRSRCSVDARLGLCSASLSWSSSIGRGGLAIWNCGIRRAEPVCSHPVQTLPWPKHSCPQIGPSLSPPPLLSGARSATNYPPGKSHHRNVCAGQGHNGVASWPM